MEFSSLAANGMYDDAAPGAGLVTGIGRVSGRQVMVVGNDGIIRTVNDAACGLLGYTREELLNTQASNIFVADEPIFSIVAGTLKDIRLEYKHKSGKLIRREIADASSPKAFRT